MPVLLEPPPLPSGQPDPALTSAETQVVHGQGYPAKEVPRVGHRRFRVVLGEDVQNGHHSIGAHGHHPAHAFLAAMPRLVVVIVLQDFEEQFAHAA